MSPEAATFPGVSGVSVYSIPLRALSDSRLTSQQLFAIWQPAWPTIRVKVSTSSHVSWPGGQDGRGGQGARGPSIGVNNNIPLSEMTSRMVAICLCDVDGRRSGGGGEVAADSVGGGWVVRWRQRCSREVFTLPGPWGRSCCEVCCAERDSQRLA